MNHKSSAHLTFLFSIFKEFTLGDKLTPHRHTLSHPQKFNTFLLPSNVEKHVVIRNQTKMQRLSYFLKTVEWLRLEGICGGRFSYI